MVLQHTMTSGICSVRLFHASWIAMFVAGPQPKLFWNHAQMYNLSMPRALWTVKQNGS